jgi:hypothetical protein
MKKLMFIGLLALLAGCRSSESVPPPPVGRTGPPAPYPPPGPSFVPTTAAPVFSPTMQSGGWVSGPSTH